MHSIRLPILEANMTHGVVRAWHKREGDPVQAGEPLFEVETDKVNAEVEAEVSGVLRQIIAPVGTRVPVLAAVALVGAADEALPVEIPSDIPPVASRTSRVADESRIESAPPHSGGRVTASPAARRLARQQGVTLEQIVGTGARGEITRADVEAATVRASSQSGSGRIDPAFLSQLRRDAPAFRALSSDMKVQLYREHGAHIEDGVRIETGAIILAQEVTIGAASTIGADSTIECEQLCIGRLSAFGRRTHVHCRSLEVGDALWSKSDVVIGGGGSDEPGARLRAGDACFFGESAQLNTCHPLTLGDEVCIGAGAKLFTHSHWQSMLRGYPSLFGPIEIGDHVFVGVNAFVFPGVTIGSGATVMVNSFVAINVPTNTFVGGVPAQVVRHIVAPTPEERVALVRDRLMPELAAVLHERGYSVARTATDTTATLDLNDGSILSFAPSWPAPIAPDRPRTLVLSFTTDPMPSLASGVTLFDLHASRIVGMQDRLSDEVREFCRHRGVRFRPFAWRYGVGHCDGDRFYPR